MMFSRLGLVMAFLLALAARQYQAPAAELRAQKSEQPEKGRPRLLVQKGGFGIFVNVAPPPHDNFAGVLPVVYHGPYEFAVPGAPNDFIMQTEVGAEVPGGNGHNGHKH